MAYDPKFTIETEYDTDPRYDYAGYIANKPKQLTGTEIAELNRPSGIIRPDVIIDYNAEYYENFIW